jgi:hypothetical protein
LPASRAAAEASAGSKLDTRCPARILSHRYALIDTAHATDIRPALHFIDRTNGGPDQRIPTAGLITFGLFFTCGGLLFLVPRYWRWQAAQSSWSGRTIFGTMPPRDELPGWRRVLWDIQEMLIERDRRRREAMQRDPRPYQLRAGATAITAGLTILIYAAIR